MALWRRVIVFIILETEERRSGKVGGRWRKRTKTHNQPNTGGRVEEEQQKEDVGKEK